MTSIILQIMMIHIVNCTTIIVQRSIKARGNCLTALGPRIHLSQQNTVTLTKYAFSFITALLSKTVDNRNF